MKKKQNLLIILSCLFIAPALSGEEYNVSSPDEKLSLKITVGEQITWSALYRNKVVLEACPVSMTINENIVLGHKPVALRHKRKTISREINVVVPTKKSVFPDVCNELTISFRGDYSIAFRVYNQGMAYRFETGIKGDVEITAEELELNFSGNVIAWFPEEERMISHFERSYKKIPVNELKSAQFCSLPVFFKNPEGLNMLFTEADLYDYPCMFLYGSEKNSLRAGFPKYVLETTIPEHGGDRNEIISGEAGYIARVNGTRTFPWRVMYICKNPGDIIENDLVYQLSSPLKLEDTGWIKPGRVAWDWWNANNVYGVDFESGINTQTYKYYIDFASAYGLEYVILDEGWSKTTTNVLESTADIDINELVRYGSAKNVGVILWLLWKPLDKNMEQIMDTYAQWGVKGIKVDFMQRADQYMVKYYERVVAEAAKHHLLVDFHGAFKPAGLRRAYPNLLSYEGVKGNEHNKWSKDITPEHTLTIPFVRMAAGPMDFTPGAMDNTQEINFFPRFTRPMSQGTRCHQVAMYIIYESPLQMLCDNPSNYYREKECTDFIARIPTVWENTQVLAAEISDYIVIARQKGDKWYIGAMTDWSEREIEIDLSFLKDGEHKIEIMQDGINANKNANDHKHITGTVNKTSKLKIKLAKGGGWAAIVSE
jgi:alpha-glucosidase